MNRSVKAAFMLQLLSPAVGNRILMARILPKERSSQSWRGKERTRSCFVFTEIAAIVLLSCTSLAMGQASVFQERLATSIKEPVTLSLTLARGNVTIGYSHEGEVVIYAFAKDALGKNVPEEYFKANLFISQEGNEITIQDSATLALVDVAGMFYAIQYRIDVPYRTAVYSAVAETGNQSLIGVTGPARLTSAVGDMNVMYVRSSLEVTTGKGNISCQRSAHVQAETGDGNIVLMEDGPSRAIVRSGRGKIEVGGARGSFQGSTDRGTLQIKAVLHDNWRLESRSGNIQIHLPPKAAFSLDASTESGVISIDRDELEQPDSQARQVHEQANGGGKRIVAHSMNGSIFIE